MCRTKGAYLHMVHFVLFNECVKVPSTMNYLMHLVRVQKCSNSTTCIVPAVPTVPRAGTTGYQPHCNCCTRDQGVLSALHQEIGFVVCNLFSVFPCFDVDFIKFV